MTLPDIDAAWRSVRLGARMVDVLDLDHPAVAARIIPDIEAGTKVYYDRRWRVSERFAEHLDAHPDLVQDLRVLVLGCGVGIEALAIAPYAQHLALNDLSATAVELSQVQLERNGFHAHDVRVGSYDEVAMPSVDLCIGSFLVYDADTLRAMTAFLRRVAVPVLLANDPMDAFDDLLHASGRRIQRRTPLDDDPIVWFEARAD